MDERKSVLIVDTDRSVLFLFRSFLEEKEPHFDRFYVDNVDRAFQIIQNRKIDALALNYKLKGQSLFEGNGVDLAIEFRKINPEAPVVLFSGIVSEAMKDAEEKGLTDRILFVGKPITFGKLTHKIVDFLGYAPW